MKMEKNAKSSYHHHYIKTGSPLSINYYCVHIEKKKSKKEKKYFEKSNQAYIRKEKKRRKKKKILLTHKKMLLGTHLKKGSGTSQTCRCQLKLVLENEMWASVRARTQCVNEKC